MSALQATFKVTRWTRTQSVNLPIKERPSKQNQQRSWLVLYTLYISMRQGGYHACIFTHGIWTTHPFAFPHGLPLPP